EFLVIRPGQPVGDFRNRRGRREKIGIEDAGSLLPKRVPPRIIRRVAPGEPRDLLLRLLNAVPQQKSLSIRQRQKSPRVNVINLESVFPQLEVLDDFRLKQVTQIRTGRKAIARKQLLRHASAAENLASLQQQYFQAGPSKVGRGHKPIVSASQHDDVVVSLRHSSVSSRPVWRLPRSPGKKSRNAAENEDQIVAPVAAGRILKVPPKLAAGSRQNSQAGGLRDVAQPSRLRVRGASEPHVPSHRQPTDGGMEPLVPLNENRLVSTPSEVAFHGLAFKF